jgi:signal transduction histidine kinase
MGDKQLKGLKNSNALDDFRFKKLEELNRQLEHEKSLLHEKLRIASKSAEEYKLLKSNFISNISHEMRTPLNAIVGFSELPFMGEVDHDEMMEYMQIIRKSSQQLLEKIKSIILISTLDSDDIPVILELVSIKRIFNEIEAFYKAAEEEGGQTVLNRLVFIVPNENDIYAKTDFEKVKLVLQQLIDNALKFSHQGTVEVGCKQTGKNQLEFYVSDTGIGIPEDKKDFVFDLFRMVDESPRRQYGGSGLGLYIVKRLLTLMNTPINLKSKVGVGTRVSFILNPNT